MRIHIVFEFEELKLPFYYNYIIQGLIYENLDKAIAQKLHEKGFEFGKRSFRLFTFSRLVGKYKIDSKTKHIIFNQRAELFISSVETDMINSLVNNIIKKDKIKIGNNVCRLSFLEIVEPPNLRRPVKVKALSPIVVYSTLENRKVRYYSPLESKWQFKILDNLKRKALALNWSEDKIKKLENSKVEPLEVEDKKHFVLTYYKNTIIKGYMGTYLLDLPEDFLTLAYNAGLGSKNSQGFGMVEVIKSDKRS